MNAKSSIIDTNLKAIRIGKPYSCFVWFLWTIKVTLWFISRILYSSLVMILLSVLSPFISISALTEWKISSFLKNHSKYLHLNERDFCVYTYIVFLSSRVFRNIEKFLFSRVKYGKELKNLEQQYVRLRKNYFNF